MIPKSFQEHAIIHCWFCAHAVWASDLIGLRITGLSFQKCLHAQQNLYWLSLNKERVDHSGRNGASPRHFPPLATMWLFRWFTRGAIAVNSCLPGTIDVPGTIGRCIINSFTASSISSLSTHRGTACWLPAAISCYMSIVRLC